jgi:hypothetical protein
MRIPYPEGMLDIGHSHVALQLGLGLVKTPAVEIVGHQGALIVTGNMPGQEQGLIEFPFPQPLCVQGNGYDIIKAGWIKILGHVLDHPISQLTA